MEVKYFVRDQTTQTLKYEWKKFMKHMYTAWIGEEHIILFTSKALYVEFQASYANEIVLFPSEEAYMMFMMKYG